MEAATARIEGNSISSYCPGGQGGVCIVPSYTTGITPDTSHGGQDPSGSAGIAAAEGMPGMTGTPAGPYAGAAITGAPGKAPGGAGNATG